MKKCLLFSLLFCSYFAFGQLHDGFDDGDFTANPAWIASNSGNDFTVTNGQLQSNNETANSTFSISTVNSLATSAVWEFWCNLQFDPSSKNYVDVYLVSNQQNLQNTNINGYFVRLGDTNDEVSLYKRSGSETTLVKLIDGTDGILHTSNNKLKIRVTRTEANTFILERDITGLGTSYVTEGTATDATYTTTSWFGLYIAQSTASFFKKHFFDDFSISAYVPDITPPKLVSAKATDAQHIEATFNEAVDATALQTANYSVNKGYGNPATVTAGTGNTYILTFTNPLAEGSYQLTASGIKDIAGNVITSPDNTVTFTYTPPYIAQPGDVVINELFADPSPQVDLPGVEFIELWNVSQHTINLKNWKYSDPTNTATLPDIAINAGEYLILCAKADTLEFKPFGKTLGISPWPSLNNAGDNLTLKSDLGTMINQVNYADSWYKDDTKKAGGWTLELIDPAATCSGIQNWSASNDASGGTPGRQNSVYTTGTTTEPLKLLTAALVDSVTVRLTFNRFVDSLIAANPTNYSVNNGLGQPISALPIAPNFETVDLKFTSVTRGYNYQVAANNITDCSGSIIASTANTANFFYAQKLAKGDILINEVLFNARTGGAKFVEIYNNTDHELDLQNLYLATTKAPDSLVTPKQVSATSLLFQPKAYMVLTTDPDNVKKEYQTQNPDAFIKMASLPSYPASEGVVVLVSDNKRIDQFNYSANMHFPLLKDVKGVSLERSSFSRDANAPGNFRSAAASVGYATPGYKNSQYAEDINSTEEVYLNSKTFSPDNDGFEDLLLINYQFDQPGRVLNATVYNDKGVLINKLAKNLTLASSGSLTWDGLDQYGDKAPVGVYIIYFETFDTGGHLKKYRKTCVLAAKL